MSKLKDVWPLVTCILLYTGFIFGGFNWMLNSKIELVNAQIELVNAQIKPINEKLGNHITETDKKIDSLIKDVQEIKATLKK